MKETTQRYDWEDALIEAETMNVITTAGANFGLRIARAINWVPNDGRPSGLYWKNELATDVVGLSRSTLMRGAKSLKAAGYLVLVNGNLLPVIPESHFDTKDAFDARKMALIQAHNDADESQIDTSKSQIDTSKSQIDTSKCQIEHPYSEDTYTEDSLSEDSLSGVAAGSPLLTDTSDSSLLQEDEIDVVSTEEVPECQIDTQMSDEDDEYDNWDFEWDIAPSNDEKARVIEEEVEERKEITWGTLHALTNRVAKDKWWDKDKQKRLMNDCLARKDNYNGTAQALVDAVVAEYVQEEGDIW